MKKNENEYTIEQLKINKDTILLENDLPDAFNV